LVTLDGVGAGVILQSLSTWSTSANPANPANPANLQIPFWLSFWLNASVAALLVSLLMALSSFYPRLRPRLKGGKLKPNVLFFADIAGIDHKAYLKELRAAVGKSPNDTTALELAYAEEIVNNAKIAVMKLRVFKRAFIFSFLAFLATCVATGVHLLVKP
jgi:hypothetical protein